MLPSMSSDQMDEGFGILGFGRGHAERAGESQRGREPHCARRPERARVIEGWAPATLGSRSSPRGARMRAKPRPTA